MVDASNAAAPDLATMAVDVGRLALLPPLQYDREREAVAERLGVRVSTLDKEVQAARPAALGPGDDGKQGAALNVPDRDLAVEPQDGAAVLAEIEACLCRHVVLPPMASAEDVLTALSSIASAVAAGDITPDEGQAVAAIVEAKRRAIETLDLERRIAALEERGQ